tara:strand:- start:2273 stop:2749 length:477 start_codon:yes stop_codon:yes gene_type:complete
MAKGNYNNNSTKENYKGLVKTGSFSKVSVQAAEKRDRAELLDQIEELFESKSGGITAEKLRAMLHILIKSTANSSDDNMLTDAHIAAINANTAKTGVSDAQALAIASNSGKTGFPLLIASNQTLSFALDNKGATLTITAVTTAANGAKATRSAAIILK